jgi:hypothetical protein
MNMREHTNAQGGQILLKFLYIKAGGKYSNQGSLKALPDILTSNGQERGPLRLVSATEELLGRKSSGSGLEIRDYGRKGSAALTTRHPSIRKSWHSLR